MNNARGCSGKGPTMFNLFDLDLAADIIWLKQVCEVDCGFSVHVEPMQLQYFSNGGGSNYEELYISKTRFTLEGTCGWCCN